MRFETQYPPPDLRHLVRFYWEYESNDHEADYVYRSMADGCAELIFTFRGKFKEMNSNGLEDSPLCHVHGPSRQYHRFFTKDHFGLFGAYLFPYAIPAIFGHSTASCVGLLPTLGELSPNWGADLEEQILHAEDMSSRSGILSQFLRAKLNQSKGIPTPIAMALREFVLSKGSLSIADLADSASLSIRQLERKTKELAGFSPKTLGRILRFQAATSAYSKTAAPNLTQLGLDCGYYDQSHFIHDFKEFSGYHPSAFFAGKGEGMEYREA